MLGLVLKGVVKVGARVAPEAIAPVERFLAKKGVGFGVKAVDGYVGYKAWQTAEGAILGNGGGEAAAADAPTEGQAQSAGGTGNAFAEFFMKLMNWLFGSHTASAASASAYASAGPGYASYDSQDVGGLENGQINARTREGEVPEGYMEVVTMENGRVVSSMVPEYELGNLSSPNTNTAQPSLANGGVGTPS